MRMSRYKLAAIALMDVLKGEMEESVDVVRLERTNTPPIVVENGVYEELTIVIGVVRKNALGTQ